MILIRRGPEGIVGVATPPHVQSPWIFEEPLSPDDLFQEMRRRGCHGTDVLDVSAESERTGFGYLPGGSD